MDFIKLAVQVAFYNRQELAIWGSAIVSAIIVLIGIMKPFVYNKIPNKEIRKYVLAFSSVAMSFAFTAVYFLIEAINWRWYVIGSVLVSIACIVTTYWLYENTPLRRGIQKLGLLVIDRIARIAKKAIVANDFDEIEKEIKTATEEIKKTAKKELKLSSNTKQVHKKERDLENL